VCQKIMVNRKILLKEDKKDGGDCAQDGGGINRFDNY